VKPRRRRIRTRLLAALALIAVIAVGVVIAISSVGSDSNSPNKPKPQRPATPAAVPRSDDPATQARDLADYLQAQSRPGAASTQQP
jgi:hypothetical protein